MSHICAITVKPGAEIIAGQDFGWRLVPPGVRFTVEPVGWSGNSRDLLRLTAPGYGMRGQYGNGSLYLRPAAWRPPPADRRGA